MQTEFVCVCVCVKMFSFHYLPSRFADKNSFEYEYGIRWKRLYEMYKEKKLLLESDLQAEVEQLEGQLAIAKHDHETEKLRQGKCWMLVASFLSVFVCAVLKATCW